MFRNSFTANDKYPVRDCQNLSSLIQMQLSLKSKTFSYFFFFFFHFWNLHQISNILKKKMIVRATLLRNFQAVKDLFRLLSKKHPFRAPFDSQHVKGSQTLVKSAWEDFHHIFSSCWENLTLEISLLVIS